MIEKGVPGRGILFCIVGSNAREIDKEAYVKYNY